MSTLNGVTPIITLPIEVGVLKPAGKPESADASCQGPSSVRVPEILHDPPGPFDRFLMALVEGIWGILECSWGF